MDTTLLAIGNLQMGLIIFGVSIPLILRQIPMNRSYGIRIPAAFKSDQNWYDINAYGGRLLAIGAVFIIGAGVAGFFISAAHFNLYAVACIANAVLALGIPILLIYLRGGKKQ